jgi:hypothetical protein
MDLGYSWVVNSEQILRRITTFLNRPGITEADRAERDEYSVSCSDVKFC